MVVRIEKPDYIDSDPIQFMHAFDDKNDQELAGFFAAIMAWGRRDIVNAKVEDLLSRMEYKPESFILNFSDSSASVLDNFKHRTFKPIDIYWLIRALQSILKKHATFENFWGSCYTISRDTNRELLAVFNEQFFSFHPEIPKRTRKHISNPEKNSSCKRLYMYLRWCLRKNSPVDPGTMNFMSTSEIKIPLDVHVARQARRLGLLKRTYNDWKAVEELNSRLLLLDPEDPSKYDFALFGVGVLNEELPKPYIVNQNIEA